MKLPVMQIRKFGNKWQSIVRIIPETEGKLVTLMGGPHSGEVVRVETDCDFVGVAREDREEGVDYYEVVEDIGMYEKLWVPK